MSRETLSRRALLEALGAVGLGATGLEATGLGATGPGAPRRPARAQEAAAAIADGAVLPLTSTSETLMPRRGRTHMQFSFDFPEPSVQLDGLRFGFRVFTHENCYGLDPERIAVALRPDGLDLECTRLTWAGGQETAPGRLLARLRRRGGHLEWDAEVEMERPIKAVATVVRGVPRGRVSAAGSPFDDRGDHEVLLGYPFSGGDLFGPVANQGLTTPLLLVEEAPDRVFFVSSLDHRVRTKRFFLQPGEHAYRLEAIVEAEGWARAERFDVPRWRLGRAASVEQAGRLHYDHVAREFGIEPFESRPDVPVWMREADLAITLHGQHFTGYVFNDYARMLEILRWIAARFPARRALAFLTSWDGRYYWDYPLYRADPRMGGEDGFRELVAEGQRLGFAMVPMFGANSANRHHPEHARFADAATVKLDGERFDLDWVDWDNDRHHEGWLSYLNLGVDSWREFLAGRISEAIERYRPDAYFLDIVGGWVNNSQADMHEGARRLIAALRERHPDVAVIGEMHYDALMGFIPYYQSFSQPLLASVIQRYARFFQHLSHAAPGRGSSGVHEAGFGRWDPETLSLSPVQVPTLSIVDDTFDRYRPEMEAVLEEAKRRGDQRRRG
jgi:hypothetical protein